MNLAQRIGQEFKTLRDDELNLHLADTSNPHSVTKAQVGLGNVDNTSDSAKPISTLTQAALNLKADKSDTYTKSETDNVVSTAINGIVDSAPGVLNTLNELAAALNDDANFATTVSNSIAGVGDDLDAHITDTSNPHLVTKAQVGLGNVDNTSDANKPISTLTQNALNGKVDVVAGKALSTNDYTTVEKTKLAGIATNANNYSLPTASATVLGGIKIGTNLSIDANGVVSANDTSIDWSEVQNKPDPVVTVTLTGDVTGSANATLTDLASGTISVATTIAANSVALGTDTTGNYVAGNTAGTGIAITGTAGEGWSPTISLATVGTAGTYPKVTTDAYGRVTAGTTLSASDIPTLNQNTTGSSGSCTGNAATATTATNLSGGTVSATTGTFSTHLRAIGTGNDYYTGGVELIGNGTTNTVFPNLGFHQPGLYASSLQLRGGGDFRFYGKEAASYANVTAATFYGALSGNAATATALATARTINGVSFDGTANITIADSTKVVANTAITAGTGTKVSYDSKGLVTSSTSLSASDIPSLDASKITSGTIDAARLPSYVDDVIEGATTASFPTTGETGKIYVALDTNKAYRWSGSAYIYITSGAVDSVAGKTGIVTLVKGDVGLGNVDNTSDANKPVSTATSTALGTKIDKVTSTDNAIVRFDGTSGAVQNSSVIIDDSGNVGIGTSSPSQLAHITKSNSGGGVELLVANSGASASGTYSQIGLGTGADSTGTVYLRLYRDGSGISELNGYSTQVFKNNGTERMRIDSSGQMWTTNGAGAVAKAYDCRAWVNFNGTGTVAIRASGNVSSITDNGTGQYTVNLSSAMPDANAAPVVSASDNGLAQRASGAHMASSSSVRVGTFYATISSFADSDTVSVAVFR